MPAIKDLLENTILEEKNAAFISKMNKGIICNSEKRLKYLKNIHGKDYQKQTEYYEIRDELLSICKGGLTETNSQNEAANILFKLYEPLVYKVVFEFCRTRGLLNDYKIWKNKACIIFRKMVCGDTPSMIKAYTRKAEDKQGRALNIWDKKIPKRHEKYSYVIDRLREDVKKSNLPAEEKTTCLAVLDYEDKNFINVVNQSIMSFEKWSEIRQRLRQKIDKKAYEDYKTDAYRDKSYDKSRGLYFTTYLKRWLLLELRGQYLYKYKEKNKKNSIDAEKIADTSTKDVRQKIDEEYNKTKINEILKTMPRRRRKIWELKIQGEPQRAIAKKLDVSEAYISKEIKKGRQQFNNIFKR